MRRIKKIYLVILILTLSTNLFSQSFPHPGEEPYPPLPGQPERPKKKFPLERKPDEPFRPVFIKNFQENDYIYLEIVFNSAVKKESVFGANILIDNIPVEDEFVLFSRDGHRCKFRIYHLPAETINIKISGIISWDGLVIPPTEITGIEKNSMYKMDKETEQWQKFSL